MVVVQARMDSLCLPGKIAAPLCGLPLLGRVVRRLQARRRTCPWGCGVPVATTTNPADDVTASLCGELRVDFFRGSENDVLDRYLAATAHLGDDHIIVRATADNPLYCPDAPRRSFFIIRPAGQITRASSTCLTWFRK